MKINNFNDIVIQCIDNYFGYKYKDNFKIRNTITDISSVTILENNPRAEITIKTYRPGILIGKAGETINALQEELTKELGLNIKILIIENDLYWWAGRSFPDY